MIARFSVLLATKNRGKLHELSALFGDLPIDLVSLSAALPNAPPVVEDGATFLDNALLKGRAGAEGATMVTIAEDSGLEVDAIGGRPGVRSARFAGESATDAENNALLLTTLDEVEDDQRAARFRCVMVLVDPWSPEPPLVAEGRCEGTIAREPRGTGGFGYDPLFVVREKGTTMAELSDQEKNEVSHRARAAHALRPHLEALIARRAAWAQKVGS